MAAQAASVDGCRAAGYVDTHVHLEMVLQKLRWYDSAPSLLEASWERLTESEQRCWRVLGYTAATWEGRKGGNPKWFKPWRKISEAERAAAQALGWDAKGWDGYDWPLPTDVLWRDLRKTTRAHLTTLGETCDSWDEMFGSRKPAGYCLGGDMRTWDLLTLAEKRAAAELGFASPTWDMCELADLHTYIRDFCGIGFEGCIAQGCCSESMDDCVKLTLSHPRVFAAFGCHPKNAWLYYEENMEERILAAFEVCGKKVVAWGEFGLDFSNHNWWEDSEYRSIQIEVFERQLKLALAKGVPLTLHVREAADDTLRILKKWVPRDWKAHVHGFHGPSEFVTAIVETFPNFCFGLTGTVGMGSNGDGARMAREVPLDRLLLETDGPYMAPKGTVFNHVGQIPLIARYVAELKGCSESEVLTFARANTRHVYGI